MASQPWAGSGTATVTAAAVDVRRPQDSTFAGSISIRNTGATNNLLVSFDDGANFVPTVRPGESFAISDAIMAFIQVKSAAATTTFEWVATGKDG